MSLDPFWHSRVVWTLQDSAFYLLLGHLTAIVYAHELIDSGTVSLVADHHSMLARLYTVLHISNLRGELQLVVCVGRLSWDSRGQCLGMVRYVGAAHAL